MGRGIAASAFCQSENEMEGNGRGVMPSLRALLPFLRLAERQIVKGADF